MEVLCSKPRRDLVVMGRAVVDVAIVIVQGQHVDRDARIDCGRVEQDAVEVPGPSSFERSRVAFGELQLIVGQPERAANHLARGMGFRRTGVGDAVVAASERAGVGTSKVLAKPGVSPQNAAVTSAIPSW